MKKRMMTLGIFLGILSLVITTSFAAANNNLQVSVEETYVGGDTVLIKIQYMDSQGAPVVLSDPERIKVEITKPDGSVVNSVARHRSWNGPGEYFDIYTIDFMGKYGINVKDSETGDEASTSFTSRFYAPGALGVLIFAVVLLAGSLVWATRRRKVRG